MCTLGSCPRLTLCLNCIAKLLGKSVSVSKQGLWKIDLIPLSHTQANTCYTALYCATACPCVPWPMQLQCRAQLSPFLLPQGCQGCRICHLHIFGAGNDTLMSSTCPCWEDLWVYSLSLLSALMALILPFLLPSSPAQGWVLPGKGADSGAISMRKCWKARDHLGSGGVLGSFENVVKL